MKISDLKIYYYRAVKGSTVKSPVVVKEFLNILNDNVQPKAAQDFQEMQKMKNAESHIKQVCVHLYHNAIMIVLF